MSGDWTQDDRERSYTRLCEAITAAGPADEALFLARLVLLLAEALQDASILSRCVAEASVARTGPDPIAPTTDASVDAAPATFR